MATQEQSTHDCCSPTNTEIQAEPVAVESCSCCSPASSNVQSAQKSAQNLVTADVSSVVDSCCAPAADDVQAVEDTVAKTKPGICPTCSTKGKKVDGATVKSMLSVSLCQYRDVPYYFCREADCDTVYFTADGTQVFGTQDVRERVFQKEPNAGDVFACYCFRHTPDSIRAEIVETGVTTVVDEVNVGINAGQCACDWRNPQDSCCLGNVMKVVKRIESEQNSIKV
ncbi:MAG: hypothetical protein Q9P01_17350 [Anaerolineae bacterium]|nr:hypothetical protein [Anaerolineae bacterium]MDQ7036527.1 hypothetical protein [Anaerolineae bacterium]